MYFKMYLFLLLSRGPSTRLCFHSWDCFRRRLFLKPPDPPLSLGYLLSLRESRASACGAMWWSCTSKELCWSHHFEWWRLNAMHMFNYPSLHSDHCHFYSMVAYSRHLLRYFSVLPLNKNLKAKRKGLKNGKQHQKTSNRSHVFPYRDLFIYFLTVTAIGLQIWGLTRQCRASRSWRLQQLSPIMIHV